MTPEPPHDPLGVRRPDVSRVHSHPENGRVPFSEYLAGGWLLECQCWRCQRVTYWSAEELVALHGPAASTGSIYTRLRCATAGCRASSPALRAVKRTS